MEIDFDNNIPIYIQLVNLLKISIISNKIKPGERLPSVRDLAKDLKVNPNTMQKALTELEDIKLIYTERTNGKYVTSDTEIIKKIRNEYAILEAKKFYESMYKAGFNKLEIIDYLNNMEGDY